MRELACTLINPKRNDCVRSLHQSNQKLSSRIESETARTTAARLKCIDECSGSIDRINFQRGDGIVSAIRDEEHTAGRMNCNLCGRNTLRVSFGDRPRHTTFLERAEIFIETQHGASRAAFVRHVREPPVRMKDQLPRIRWMFQAQKRRLMRSDGRVSYIKPVNEHFVQSRIRRDQKAVVGSDVD